MIQFILNFTEKIKNFFFPFKEEKNLLYSGPVGLGYNSYSFVLQPISGLYSTSPHKLFNAVEISSLKHDILDLAKKNPFSLITRVTCSNNLNEGISYYISSTHVLNNELDLDQKLFQIKEKIITKNDEYGMGNIIKIGIVMRVLI